MRALPLVALLGCGGAGTPSVARIAGAASAIPAAPQPAVARQLTNETTIATHSGTPLAVPKGWWLTEGQEALLVEDRERMKRLAGSYENARLGSLILRPTAAGASLDAGEWSGALGQRIGRDGTLTLVFLDPPFPGAEYTVGGDDTSPTLTVTDRQSTYTFTRDATHR